MYKKLTALVLSIIMVASMACPTALAVDTQTPDAPAADNNGAQQSESFIDDVEFTVESVKLPASSGDGEEETKVSGDFEYVVDTSVDEVTITKYTGNEVYVEIPEKIDGMPVVALGPDSFRAVPKLKEVKFPNTLVKVDNYAFAECERLETAELPDSVEQINERVFYKCAKLKSFKFPKNWTKSTGGGGILNGCTQVKSVSVPEGVESIPGFAFASSSIESITLPSTLKKLEERAFLWCYDLKSLELPDSVETIGEYAIEGCNSLTEITLPAGLKRLENNAFQNCERLEKVTMPDGLEFIGRSAFVGCKKLRTANFPKNVETIEGEIFKECDSLRSITIPEGVTVLPDRALNSSPALETVDLPSTLKSIGAEAFSDCRSLKSAEIPQSVNSIGNNALSYCESLKTVELPETIEAVPNGCFAGCVNLESVVLPAKLRTIGSDAFANCERLTSIEIPEGVESIGTRAFKNCRRLESFTYPKKLEAAEGEIFTGCEKLKEITIPEGVEAIPAYMFDNANFVETINLPSTLTTLGKGSISRCANLKSIDLPDSLTTVGDAVFYQSALTELTIPDGVKSISADFLRESHEIEKVTFPKELQSVGHAAFYQCYRIKSVELPDTVRQIDSYAFEQCTSLESFTYPAGWETANSNIFLNCENLKEITVPEGIKTIPAYAFAGANYLETVNLPSTLKTVSNNAFENCASITRIVLPDSVTMLGRGAFVDCRSLESINFPDGLTTIDPDCFRQCEKLTSANLPDSVKSLGARAFMNCFSLSAYTYPAKLETIVDGSEIFRGCENLTEIRVPDGVKTIPAHTFEACDKLTSILLPNSVTKIGEHAFTNCVNLTELTLPTTVKDIAINAFDNTPQLTLYCPKYNKSVISFIERKINVVSNNDERMENTKVIDSGRSSYSLLSGSKIRATVSYTIKNSVYANARDLNVAVYIPDGAIISQDSLYRDGELVTDLSENGNVTTIPVAAKSGKITFTLETSNDFLLRTYAILNYRLGNDQDFDIIDIINEDYEILTLNAEDIVSSDTIEVYGFAPAESSVDIYVNETLATTAETNKGGVYTAEVSLGAVSENDRIRLRAETLGKDGNMLTAEKTVRYSEMAPKLTGLTMYYNGLSYNLLSGVKHNVVFRLEGGHGVTPFKFTVEYKNTQKIERVYVTSTRNQVTKKMLAKYDASLGLYVAEGFFDPSDHDYVPGKIGVEYVEKPDWEPYSLSDFDTMYNGDMLPEVLQTATHELVEETDTRKTVNITTTDGDVIVYTYEKIKIADFRKEYEKTHGVASNAADIKDALKDYGFAVRTENGTTIYASFDKNAAYNDTIAWTYQVGKDFVEKETIKFGKSSAKKMTLMHISENELEGFFASGLNYASTDTEEYIVCRGYIINYTKARAAILSSSISQEQKNKKLDQLNELRRNAIELTAVKLIGCYLKLIGLYQFGDYPALSPVIYVIDCPPSENGTKGGGAGGSETSDQPGTETGDEGDGDGDGEGDGASGNASGNSSYYGDNLNFSIDPSGFVYEAVTSNRVAQAKVTAYWIPYDDSNDAFWDSPDESKAIVWNSAEYSQENPLLTDDAGAYAWDVPEGWWRVCVEKDGYEIAYSDWLPVPPPQLDVNICLSLKAAPKIVNIETTEDSITVTFDQYMDPKAVATIVLTDKNGEAVEYKLEYSKSETNANGEVFAKVFKLIPTEKTASVTLNVPETVTSYCGVPSESKTEELKLFEEPEPETIDEPKPETKDDPEPKPETKDEPESETKDEPKPETKDEPEPETKDDPEPKPEPVGTFGDIDRDELITANDALAALRTSVGMQELSELEALAADVDGDGSVTANDALDILRVSVGMEGNPLIGTQIMK